MSTCVILLQFRNETDDVRQYYDIVLKQKLFWNFLSRRNSQFLRDINPNVHEMSKNRRLINAADEFGILVF